MSGRSRKSPREKSGGETSTPSPESGGGPSPSDLPAGTQLDLFGQALAPASPSRRRARGGRSKTTDISGPCGFGSSSSADLQRYLGNKLRALLEGAGSPEYELTWSRWVMPSGAPICRLRASARPTSGSDCSGWPTCQAADGLNSKGGMAERANGQRMNLVDYVELTGWPTASARDGKGCGGSEHGTNARPLNEVTDLVISGPATSSFSAGTASTGVPRLNPGFSLWLMGYSDAWLSCGVRAIASSRRRRQSSSAPSSKRKGS